MKNQFDTPQGAINKLIIGNKRYLGAYQNPANISPQVRRQTAYHGQKPYAVVLTCADSRVPPEHIFSAGIGDLFVVRVAGNVVGDFELGSIEFGIEQLGASVIVIMGHSQCAAVATAFEGEHVDGYMEEVIHEIQLGIRGATNEMEAIYDNVLHSKNRIMLSNIVRKFVKSGKVLIVCAVYDMETGRVQLFEC